jgi:TPR repeat protein
LYQFGWGVKKDLPTASKWYRKAAEKGDALAQANLGLIYQDGPPPDLMRAYVWFKLSAERGNGIGKRFFYDYTYHNRLTPEQLAEANRMIAAFHAKMGTNQPAMLPNP